MGQISRVLRSLEGNGLLYWCQGCESAHAIHYGQGDGPRWEWDGNAASPTFSPSVLVRWNQAGSPRVCHTFIRDGIVEFLNDCTHRYAGKTLPLPNLPDGWRDDYNPGVLLANNPPQGSNLMSKIKVAVATVDAPLPAGAALYAVILLAVTDSSGTLQTARLNGQEEDPFSTVFEVADGTGTVSAVALDVNDQVIEGSSIDQSFTVGVPAAPVGDPPVVDEQPASVPPVDATFKRPATLTVTPVEG